MMSDQSNFVPLLDCGFSSLFFFEFVSPWSKGGGRPERCSVSRAAAPTHTCPTAPTDLDSSLAFGVEESNINEPLLGADPVQCVVQC
jgi:hypothetical protein